ncbi:MAG: dihydropteroate synthase [Proteobacteria bacterium]|nr:dihydropteroate synthase [Pseudomonadota bacterium]MBU1686680.1 dihydropteroate synthase [Pseudomonadota bacterium]
MSAAPSTAGDSFALSALPQLMGILNVTPDSFSDGGKFTSEHDILSQTEKLIRDGADILDIGGESTRPFAPQISVDEEISRVIPAITAIRRVFPDIPISIDTTKAEVARRALAAGATIVNDISALRFDPSMSKVVLTAGSPVILMHMQGSPGNMQNNPIYDDVIRDIKTFLSARINQAVSLGIDRKKIIIDPGIGFGKTLEHNLVILNRLNEFQDLGCRLLVGHSRKSFIGKILGSDVTDRDVPTAVISALCAMKGVDIIRVHDIETTAQAIKLAMAIKTTGGNISA